MDKIDNYVYNKTMLMAGLICMFVATAILAIGVCFIKKNKSLSLLFQTLSLIALLCLGFVAGSFKNNFSGFSILLILSIAPQFLSIFDLKEFFKSKQTNNSEINILQNESISSETKIEEDSPESGKRKKKKESKHYFLSSNGNLLSALASFMSAICIAFCGLYLGVETFYGFLIGGAIGFALMFLILIIKKNINPFDLLGYFLMFLAFGLFIGQIVTVLMYSFSIVNIIYSIGALIFGAYILLLAFLKRNFIHIVYFLAMFCLICTLII